MIDNEWIPSIGHRAEERDAGTVHTLTVSNPHKLNVLTARLMDELREAVSDFGSDESSRVVILRGAGSAAWIGGVDSDEMAELDPDTAIEFIRKLHELCSAIREAPVPVLAVIRGYCLGPGLEVAASCDMRLAADDASFGMPEAYAGMPAVTEAALLPGLIGIGHTRELVLTGRLIDTRTAWRWGLIESMVPGPGLDAFVESRVQDILMGGPRAIRMQKLLCKVWEERPLKEAIEIGIKAFGKAFEGREPGDYFDRRARNKETE
jgi:enoyl-CoA hydratase/carnithine racemase